MWHLVKIMTLRVRFEWKVKSLSENKKSKSKSTTITIDTHLGRMKIKFRSQGMAKWTVKWTTKWRFERKSLPSQTSEWVSLHCTRMIESARLILHTRKDTLLQYFTIWLLEYFATTYFTTWILYPLEWYTTHGSEQVTHLTALKRTRLSTWPAVSRWTPFLWRAS